MTGFGKMVTGILILAIAVIGWAWWNYSTNNQAATITQTGMQASTTPETGTSSTTASAAASPAAQIASGDSSNASLSTDLNAIDTQMNTANSDSAAVNQSFNDQPVQQAQ